MAPEAIGTTGAKKEEHDDIEVGVVEILGEPAVDIAEHRGASLQRQSANPRIL